MKSILLITFLLTMLNAAAQDNSKADADLSKLTDDLLSFQDENTDYENQYENYAQLFSSPLNLNKATSSELRLPGILTDQQISELIAHIDKYGPLLSIYELQSLPSLDTETIRRIEPFVDVRDPKENLDRNFVHRLTTADVYFLSRWERRLSYPSGKPEDYAGSADRLYSKFRASSVNDYSVGFTLEKDAGEAIQWQPERKYFGFDYVSAHAQISNKRWIRNLIAGDYQYQFGQGLILGSGFGFGKGAETITAIRKSNIGFLPYTSANEAGYMRGFATTISIFPRVNLSAFYSNTKRDASLSNDSNGFSSIIVSGLHRNSNELLRRKVIGEISYGAVIEYRHRQTEGGVIVSALEYSTPSNKELTPYNQFAFKGSQLLNAGVFLSTVIDNVSVFTEAAHAANGGFGMLAGALVSISRSFDAAILFRNYQRSFISIYSNALSENTKAQNETGMYWGLKWKMNKRYTASAYIDLFRFPWLKFGTYQPSSGSELFGRLQYQPSKKTLLYAQWRREQKSKNALVKSPVYDVTEVVKTNICLNAEYWANEKVKLKSRFQMSEIDSRGYTSGLALTQDIAVRQGKFKFTARYALFDTDNFDNRQYSYESDMLMAYSFPAYQDSGTRKFLMVECKLNKLLTVWIRYAETRLKATDPEASTGDQKDLKCQIIARF
jgi:hypothetical protein